MKQTILIILLFTISSIVCAQTEIHKNKFKELEPDIWLGIWDKKNSCITFKIDTLSYDDVPKYLDFKGTIVEALKWTDSQGENILLQTVTGQFVWKEYNDKDSTDFTLQDKSELYSYLFQKSISNKEFKIKWRIYDYNKCYGVDWFTGFIPKATTITDLDNDGISEITIPYVTICRGGMDPGTMKIILYEDNTKYVLRGTTMLMCDSKTPYGGEFSESENLKENTIFHSFLTKHWSRNKCEDGKFY
jgi:hypothetical protein